MNVLWLMADQMRGDTVGFMGHPIVQTPHLDRLASESMVFENAFAQSPICGPSRTCLFTGRYVREHGVWWNGVPYSAPFPVLPEILRASGFQTSVVGKLHFAPPERDFGFHQKDLHEELLLDGTGMDAYQRFLQSHNPPSPDPYEATEWMNETSGLGICRAPEAADESRWVADRTCELLRSGLPEPFFLFSSLVRPHSPYNPLPRFLELYADADVPAPEFSVEEWDRLPPRVRATAESWGWDTLTPFDFAEVRRHYYALCSQVDESIGRILSCLSELSLLDETMIVFVSDHGDFLGEHGLLYKEHLYDGSLHIPLVIRTPGRACGRARGLVESIDVMPTVLEAAGVDTPSGLSGKSLMPCFDEPSAHQRDAVFSEWTTYCVNDNAGSVMQAGVNPSIKSVRSTDWRYTHYTGEPGELYKLDEDPGERWNLFADPGHADARSRLQTRMLDWLTETEPLPPAGPHNPYFQDRLSAVE